MGRRAKTEKAKTEKAGKDREGKKTEKAKRQRRQKDRGGGGVYSEMFVSYNDRRAVIVQRISWEYGRSALWIVIVPVNVQPC